MVATSIGLLSSPARVMTCIVPRSNLTDVTRFQKTVIACLGALALMAGFARGDAQQMRPGLESAPRADGVRVVVSGVGALLWAVISAAESPALFELATASDLSSLSVRTDGEITCPADGWLTLATGRRTLAAPRGADPVCGAPPAVDLSSPRPLVDVEQLAEVNRQLGWRPQLGEFGAAVQEAGLDATGVGLGGALTLFDEEGTTPRFFS